MILSIDLGSTSFKTALAAGGGSLQPVWRRCVAEALGAKLKCTEARPLLGAARMAVEAT
jgi:sugar (pentulose or hexulose) kinase